MKMPQAVYEDLRNDVRAVVDKLKLDLVSQDHGKTGLKAMYALRTIVERNRSYDDEHPGFKQKVWTRVLPFTGRKACYLYDLGLSDTHIATALRKIKEELQQGK